MFLEILILSIIFFSLLIQLDNLQIFNELNKSKQYMRDIEKEIEIKVHKLNEIIYIQKKILEKIEVLINNNNIVLLYKSPCPRQQQNEKEDREQEIEQD